jgi:TP901 family phage tail tape measure protein
MADRVTTVHLRAEIADLKRQMADAGLAVKGVGDQTEKAAQRSNAALGQISNTAGLLGAALVAAAALAVKAFADFDQSMSAVQAATHESAQNMDLLREASLEAGARTVFSATEAAGAVEELAKAGVKTADILTGGLNGALDLAAAGGLDVAEAAGIAAIALQQFKLKGEKIPHVADLLAAGAGKAMGSVSDLGMALRQAGQVANSTGLSIEETTAGLSAFASAGLIGSDAGTSFKAMLQRLTPQSAEAQAAMDRLGISAYDSGGNFVGLAKFSGNLRSALKDLTPEQRNSALATIFGSDAVRAANVLYDEGEQGIRDWTAAVDDQGFAAETAALRLDNLKGDLEQLSGSIETALISAGESADGPLRSLVQGATDFVNALADAPDAVQGVMLALVGGGGLVLLGAAGLGKLVVGISEVKAALAALKISGKTAGLAMAGIGVALAAATVVVSAWTDETARAREMTGAFSETLDKTAGVTNDTAAAIRDMLAEGRNVAFLNFDSAYTEAERMGIAFDTLTEYVLGNKDAIDEVNAAGRKYIDESSVWESITLSRESSVQNLRYSLDAMAGSLTEAQRVEAQKIKADAEAATRADELAKKTATTTGAIEDQTDALKDLIDAQREAAGLVLSVRDAELGLQAAIDDAAEALKKNGRNLDIGTEAGRENRAALDEIASSTWDLIASMEASGATQGALQATMATGRQSFLDAAKAQGVERTAAKRLADSLGLIPTSVSTVVAVSTDKAQTRADKFIAAYSNRSIPMVVTLLADVGALTAAQRAAYSAARSASHAAGGAIRGPGTPTSDSIPIWASDGEHVLTAREVDSVGGQDAVYRMRAAIRSGALRFADGGGVSRYGLHMIDPSKVTQLSMPRFAVGGAVSGTGPASLAGLAIEGTLDLGDGLVGMMRGVVTSELADVGSRLRYAGGV